MTILFTNTNKFNRKPIKANLNVNTTKINEIKWKLRDKVSPFLTAGQSPCVNAHKINVFQPLNNFMYQLMFAWIFSKMTLLVCSLSLVCQVL